MFKPMLAVNADMAKIKYPVYASPKLDGIRCSIVNGVALTRTLKGIPNAHVSRLLSMTPYTGLDGELIVGSPTSPTCYRDTVSNIMAYEKVPTFTYYVFDIHNMEDRFEKRLRQLEERQYGNVSFIQVLPQALIQCAEDLVDYEAETVAAGYEGIILRSPDSPYKFGRSTVNESYLLKVKRFEDSEAEIIGFEEEMFNGNVAETNELGRTKRSTAQSGLVGKNTLGAFQVRDCVSGVEFSVGTGLTAEQRQVIWNNRQGMLGDLVKYKFFPVGVKDKPRHPVFLGMRDQRDL